MDKVKFSPLNEIIRKDLANIGEYSETAFQDMIYDFLTEGTTLVTGLRVRAQAVPDMSVYVEVGRIYQKGLQGCQTENLAQPLVIIAAHNQYDRIDRICAQYSAMEDLPETRNRMVDVTTKQVTQAVVNTRIHGGITYLVVAGTATAAPVAPAIPDGFISLAKVTVHSGTNNIQNTDIFDERPTIRSLLTHTHSGGGDGTVISYNSLTNKPDMSGKLDKSGGTLTGPLALAADPVTDMQAATKQYVDANGVTDAKIGTRTINDTVPATAEAGLLTSLLSKLGYMIKSITGKSNWYTAPALTLEVLNSLIVSVAAANKLLKLDANSKLPADITGNAATATTLQTARTIGASGDVTGAATSFNGDVNITIPMTLANSGVGAGTYRSVTVDSKGRVTGGTNPTTVSGYGITDALSTSDVVTAAAANKLLKLDANSKLPADITGNAATATKLQTARTIALTGDVTGSASFDGSNNASIATTITTKQIVTSWRSGRNWYRVYSDGEIEQGGYFTASPVTFPYPFTDVNSIVVQVNYQLATNAGSAPNSPYPYSVTTTGFSVADVYSTGTTYTAKGK